MKQLAEFVREHRKEINLIQKGLAEKAGAALKVLQKIEQVKITAYYNL